MGIRHRSRELAMQALFYMDMSDEACEDVIANFSTYFIDSKNPYPFFIKLVRGVADSIDEIDALITRFSSNWKISRMSCVDRNIIRVAVYELIFCFDIPPKVSINEAIDIGKKFSTLESGAFINGILDGINKAIEKNEIKAIKNDGADL
mmetsp:Transcript_11794/g.5931  ORF Transcript_11794/g.5931 Transcript_11794/m.5931 type:complete len:149 (-) Transcript_11794:79-525(-)